MARVVVVVVLLLLLLGDQYAIFVLVFLRKRQDGEGGSLLISKSSRKKKSYQTIRETGVSECCFFFSLSLSSSFSFAPCCNELAPASEGGGEKFLLSSFQSNVRLELSLFGRSSFRVSTFRQFFDLLEKEKGELGGAWTEEGEKKCCTNKSHFQAGVANEFWNIKKSGWMTGATFISPPPLPTFKKP